MECWPYIEFRDTANSISLWEIRFLMKVSRRSEKSRMTNKKRLLVFFSALTLLSGHLCEVLL